MRPTEVYQSRRAFVQPQTTKQMDPQSHLSNNTPVLPLLGPFTSSCQNSPRALFVVPSPYRPLLPRFRRAFQSRNIRVPVSFFPSAGARKGLKKGLFQNRACIWVWRLKWGFQPFQWKPGSEVLRGPVLRYYRSPEKPLLCALNDVKNTSELSCLRETNI